jgi:hypothetical protein
LETSVPGYSLLAPVPEVHVNAALDVLKSKPFVCFGSDSFEVFVKLEVGTKVYIYVSHAKEGSEVVGYTATYRGTVNTVSEMKKLESEGYRPATAGGEQWGFFWKVSDLASLAKPLPLSLMQLPSGKYLTSAPRGPLQVAS